MLFPPKSVLDIGAASWISFMGLQASSSPIFGSETQNVIAACAVALSIVTIIYGVGRLVERFQQRGVSNQNKLIVEDRRMENIEKIVTGIEKDLIGRRALVDKEISHHSWQIGALEDKMRVGESRHNRLRDKFNVVVGSLAPVLKDMDADFTRGGTMAKVFTAIDEGEQPTDDGSSA
jgi:hypothetical protein